MKVRIILVIAILAIPLWVSAETTINRSFSKIALGMSIEALQAAYETKEIASSTLLPGERLFGVDGQFPDIERVWCSFYLGKLFRIEFSYSPQYSQQVPWESFVEFMKRRYGEGWSFESTQGEVVMWNDGQTSFVLERKTTPKSSSVYVVSLVDDSLYDARQESCPAKKYKV
ncbi:MAG TPA: hypothetical protein VJM77_02775 [Nitrospiria bacterium]|nr:hypothetical protein [Nitrospiria bacterium]